MIATLIFAALFIACGLLAALFGLLTGYDSGRIGWPRWPARYPARPRLLVGDDEWDDTASRAGWEPGDDGEQVRT